MYNTIPYIDKNILFDNSLFNELFQTKEDNLLKLPIEIENNETNILIKAEIPGFNKEDIKISLEKNILSIEAERKYEKKENKFTEFKYGKIKRSFSLENIKEDSIEAKYENGILIIKIDKIKKEENKKLIEIK